MAFELGVDDQGFAFAFKHQRLTPDLSNLEAGVAVNMEDVFQGLEVQRLRLHHDQQVPEWKEKWWVRRPDYIPSAVLVASVRGLS
jgi:hypothetical protein